MKIENDFERKIKQKEEEIQGIREKLLGAEAYLNALKDSLRLIKRVSSDYGKGVVRAGSLIDKARKALLDAGKPLRVEDLLRNMGKEVNKKTKVSLSGSLGSYVRQEYIFTRPAPNTFGLIEFKNTEEDEVPDGFGTETF